MAHIPVMLCRYPKTLLLEQQDLRILNTVHRSHTIYIIWFVDPSMVVYVRMLLPEVGLL